jgi:hypothetical protein
VIKGRSIRMFLVDGTPNGIISAEIMNWTGHVLAGPRTLLPDLLKRSEITRTGIYLLTGPDPEVPSRALAYIGESDNVGKRLAQHNRDEDKDYWDHACVVTSKDQNLTKAHVRYVESRLISIAGAAGRATLANGTAPYYGYLPEADIADMEFFIEQIRIVLPVLGLDLLRDRPTAIIKVATLDAATMDTPQEGPVFELISKKHDLYAQAREIDGDFIVLADSLARDSWEGVHDHHYGALHKQLVEEQRLVPAVEAGSGKLKFIEDYAFRSPSAASAVIVGRADNGRTSWRIKGTNKTYADWQNEKVAAAAGPVETG